MYTTTMTQPDPGPFMQQFLTDQVAQKANKWQGQNIVRWQNADYDALYNASQSELDPVKRASQFIQMNDMVIKNVVIIPVVYRPGIAGVRNDLYAPLSGWDSDLWELKDWYRKT
ncbi:MAG: peptide ABC transporter substrate-binding protein, partial [Acetobacteraceae bacterium]